MNDTLYWKTASGNSVRCELCPFECLIPDGGHGQCRVRANSSGRLVSLVHNRISGMGLDPVEKKPLYHWFPGRQILSIGTMGCNLHCRFCQNSDISQTGSLELETISPERLLDRARAAGSVGIAFTYSEPSVWIETILEVAPVFHKAGLRTAMITNGYINPAPLKDLVPHIDAMNIDVKAFRDDFYHKVCGASLAPVLKNVETLAKTGVWIELTMLLVPGLNDSTEEISDFCRWAGGINRSIPVHFSRYFPRYKMDTPATPEETLIRAANIGREHLDFVYIGNVCLAEGCATNCAKCGNALIRRHPERIETSGLNNGACSKCGTALPGRF
jgi:pyruvate formate lyase activating enzyme